MKRRFRLNDDDFEEEEWEKDREVISSINVHEPDGPEPTGLLDQDGTPIMRARNPIGFLADL